MVHRFKQFFHLDTFVEFATKWKKYKNIDLVSEEERNIAEQALYGLIYEMGEESLCGHLNINKEECAKLITSFKETYPEVGKYRRKIGESALALGYVTTMMGNKRYLFAKSKVQETSSSGIERRAINTTIQG